MPTPVLRHLPSVSELLEAPVLKGLVDRVSHNAVVAQVRGVLDEVRQELQTSAAEKSFPQVSDLAERIARRVLQGAPAAVRPVINATGVVLSAELGRAPLSEAAVEALIETSRDYSSSGLDLSTGQAAAGTAEIESLLRELTGAEAALVVGTHGAALSLAVAALAGGRSVAVSRGQLAEMSEGYRVPELIAASGAALREIGTTNRTLAGDYRQAAREGAAALLVIEPDNYRVDGVAESVELADVVRVGREAQIPTVHDVAGGALVDFARYGLQDVPQLPDSLSAGADLVLTCGDRLIGGPTCGIIMGRRATVDRLAAHPLRSALGVSKQTLAALAATLQLYRDPATLDRTLPILSLLATSAENLKNRAERLAPQMAAAPAIAEAVAIAGQTTLTGVALPGQRLDTWSVALRPVGRSLERLAAQLRQADPAVVGRIEGDRLLLDLRSVFPRQDTHLVAAVEAIGAQAGGPNN